MLVQRTNAPSIKSSSSNKQKGGINGKQGKTKLCKGFKRTRGVKSKVLDETKYRLQFVFLSKAKGVGRGNQDMYNHSAYTVYRMDTLGLLGMTVRKKPINPQ